MGIRKVLRVSNKECFVIKDLVRYYGIEGVEGETQEWLEQHVSTCESCQNWVNSQLEEDEPIGFEEISLAEDERKLIQRVQWTFRIGIGVILLLGAWVSFWLTL